MSINNNDDSSSLLTLIEKPDNLNLLIDCVYDGIITTSLFFGTFCKSRNVLINLFHNIVNISDPEAQAKFLILIFENNTLIEWAIKEINNDSGIGRNIKILLNRYPNILNLYLKLAGMGVNDNKDLQILGQTIHNASSRWSPVSNAGKIYEFDRGAIGIDTDGKITKKVIDDTISHHDIATKLLIIGDNEHNRGQVIDEAKNGIIYSPFELGLQGAEVGKIIIQLEGNILIVFLPNEITKKQCLSLMAILAPRRNFIVSFSHNNDIYEGDNNGITIDYLEKFAIDIVKEVPKIQKNEDTTQISNNNNFLK